MKYYNKPVEWIDKLYSDGKRKREITKRIPVLECKRNPEHFYKVDPPKNQFKIAMIDFERSVCIFSLFDKDTIDL